MTAIQEASARLSPPLVQKWQFIQGHSPNIPLISSGKVFVRTRTGTVVLDEVGGTFLEGLPDRSAIGVVDDQVLFISSDDKEALVDIRSGRSRAFGGQVEEIVALTGSYVVMQGLALRARERDSGRELWSLSTKPPNYFSGVPAATDRAVVYGMGDGEVVCVGTETGGQRWRHSVSDLPWFSSVDTECYPTGRLAIYKDRVIVQARGRFVVGLDLRDGKRVWTHGSRGFVDGSLVEGRYYVVGDPYVVLDPENGRALFEGELQRPKDIPGAQGGINGPAAISETHVYCATHFGPIIAWERETGKVADVIKGKGACGSATIAKYLLIKNGRLYYADASLSVFCFEEENPTDPVLMKQRAEAKAGGRGAGVIAAGVLDFSGAKDGSSKRSLRVAPKRTSAAKRLGRAKPAAARRKKTG